MNSPPTERQRGNRFLLVLLAAVLSAAVTLCVDAAESAPTEYDYKLDWLYRLSALTEWPVEAFESPTTPFVLGVLGRDPWKGQLQRLYQATGRSEVKKRPLVVTNCAEVAEARKCHLVFITKSEQARVPQILAELKGANVLTVLEADHYAVTDAVIVVYVTDSLQVVVNLEAAAKARLVLGPTVKRRATKILKTAG